MSTSKAALQHTLHMPASLSLLCIGRIEVFACINTLGYFYPASILMTRVESCTVKSLQLLEDVQPPEVSNYLI